MMSLVNRLVLFLHDWRTRRKMERVFRRDEDPYGYTSHPHEIQKQDVLESFLGNRRYGSALEIGCAEGAFTRRLAHRCDRVTAVDICATALSRARERLEGCSNVELIRTNARDFDLSKGWELIVICEVLYYMNGRRFLKSGLAGFLARVARSLKPGGRLVVLHSFADDKELVIRKGYVETLLRQGSLHLVMEQVGGHDPRKCRYLISVLEW